MSSYEREIERYGGLELMELCEKLFCVDSYLTLKLLEFESKELPVHIIGALSVLDLLKHLLSDTLMIHDFFNRLDLDREGLSGYRDWRKIMEAGFTKIFGSIGDNRARILSEIATKVNEVDLRPVNIYSLAASIIHMHCNRLCGIDPSLENMVKVYAAHFIKNFFIKKSFQITSSETFQH